ncbi:class I SAM-dependent methyltransferase [Aquihabitans sp. McL0605]|uniref:class I SAM-dependent methyltransferase n=1 Tax=Aquihabitans sp. McL0605 TaxID=3415671 RepID=UPI003CED347A
MSPARDAVYDEIGRTYTATRRPDPRVARQILEALGDAGRVLNVGAGAGSYEPADGREVVALEPSAVMRTQRPPGSAPCVGGLAGALPFTDGTFDATLTVFSVHHWPDPRAGLDELRRVAPRNVIVTFDPAFHNRFWLVRDYLPEVAAVPAAVTLAPQEILDHLGGGAVAAVPVAADCADGFFWAYWRRPEAYLDPSVRAGISGLALLPDELVAARMERLAADLASGAWQERNADLLARDEVDAGYRLIVADAGVGR